MQLLKSAFRFVVLPLPGTSKQSSIDEMTVEITDRSPVVLQGMTLLIILKEMTTSITAVMKCRKH